MSAASLNHKHSDETQTHVNKNKYFVLYTLSSSSLKNNGNISKISLNNMTA